MNPINPKKLAQHILVAFLWITLALAQPGLPLWQTHPLRDIHSGEVFTLSDFRGQTVFVEGMASWCGHCLQQLRNIASLKDKLPPEIVLIALSVDTNATAEELISYADKEGFDWRFAIVPPDLLIELAEVFGQKFTRPLSHFIIYADGSFSELDIGLKTTEELQQLLFDALNHPEDASLP